MRSSRAKPRNGRPLCSGRASRLTNGLTSTFDSALFTAFGAPATGFDHAVTTHVRRFSAGSAVLKLWFTAWRPKGAGSSCRLLLVAQPRSGRTRATDLGRKGPVGLSWRTAAIAAFQSSRQSAPMTAMGRTATVADRPGTGIQRRLLSGCVASQLQTIPSPSFALLTALNRAGRSAGARALGGQTRVLAASRMVVRYPACLRAY